MSIIRCYMSFRDGIHSARAMHVHAMRSGWVGRSLAAAF